MLVAGYALLFYSCWVPKNPLHEVRPKPHFFIRELPAPAISAALPTATYSASLPSNTGHDYSLHVESFMAFVAVLSIGM
eukprot:22291-Eustigmatos_ZCMA.PRE.1